MAAVRALAPQQIFDAQQWQRLKQVSRWKGLALVAHCWLVIIAAIALALWSAHWHGWLVAIILIGSRQLGLAILMHEAAHGLLHPDRKVNNFVGQWLTASPVGSDLYLYRHYHLTHHRYTQQPEDPDLSLSAAFPTSRISLLRKIVRDLSGIAFLRARLGQVKIVLASFRAGSSGESGDEAARVAEKKQQQMRAISRALWRFLGVNAMLLGLSLLSGFGPWPFVLWWLALMTSFQLFLRIRNIAEHACTPTGADDPFSHARTTRAGWLARATLAPYWVNYHSEHHLFMGIACYNLPEAHRLLCDKGYDRRMIIAPGYLSVLRQVTQPGPV